MRTPSRLSIAALAIISLAGCASPSLGLKFEKEKAAVPLQLAESGLRADAGSYGSPERVAARAEEYRSVRVVRHSSMPYIGGRMVASTNEDDLPAVFFESYNIDFGRENVSLAVAAARLTKLTGVPVRLRPDVYRPAAGATPATAMPNQVGSPMPTPLPMGVKGQQPAGFYPQGIGGQVVPNSAMSSDSTISIDSINMKWNGRLRDFLDHLTNSLSLAWEYRDGAVVIMRMVTETYEVAAFAGLQKFSITTGGTGTGSGNSGQTGQSQTTQASMSVSQSGETDARKSLVDTLKNMVSSVPGSTINVNEGTGRIVVTTSKEIQAQVRDYVRSENKYLRQMVNVTFDVYSLTTSDTDSAGVDWSLVYKAMSGRFGAALKSPSSIVATNAGSIGTSILSGQFTNSTAVVNLLREYGNAVQHRPVNITTVNGQWNTKTRLSTDGYLKETTPGVASSSGGAGAPGLKTDTVTTGDQFAVLPQVLQDSSIMLKYSIGLSDLLGLFDVTTGSGDTLQKVQTPRIDSSNDNSTLVLAPGETAMVTGLSRLVSSSSDARLTEGAPMAFGGSRKLSVKREHFIVLIRATPI